jgi:hypothetical protein
VTFITGNVEENVPTRLQPLFGVESVSKRKIRERRNGLFWGFVSQNIQEI